MYGNYAFVMMVKEKWWIKFRDRNQEEREVHSFVVRGAAPPKNAEIILFYVTNPVKELSGHAEYIEREVGNPHELWEKYGNESVLSSRAQYEEFIGSAQKVSFVRFKNLQNATNPIPLATFLKLLGVRRLSRKGFYLDKVTADKLISIMA